VTAYRNIIQEDILTFLQTHEPNNRGRMPYLKMLQNPSKNPLEPDADDFQNLISSFLSKDTYVVKFLLTSVKLQTDAKRTNRRRLKYNLFRAGDNVYREWHFRSSLHCSLTARLRQAFVKLLQCFLSVFVQKHRAPLKPLSKISVYYT